MASPFSMSPLPRADFRHVGRPLKSSERAVWLSTGPTLEVGDLLLSAGNNLQWIPDPVEVAVLSTSPSHLAVLVDGALPDIVHAMEFTVAGVDEDDVPATGCATLSVPEYSRDRNWHFPRCWSAGVVTATGKRFKSVTSVSVVSHVSLSGRFKLFGLPDLDTFQRIGCIGSVGFTPRGVTPFSMRCGDNPQAFVVEGDLVEGRLTINAKYFNMTEGLARLNGTRCCAMIEDVRARRVTTGRTLCTGYYPVPGESGSEGPEAVVNDSDAPIEESLLFCPGPRQVVELNIDGVFLLIGGQTLPVNV